MPSDNSLFPSSLEYRENYNRLILRVGDLDPSAADWMDTLEARQLVEEFGEDCRTLAQAFQWWVTAAGYGFWSRLDGRLEREPTPVLTPVLTDEYLTLVAKVRRIDPAAADYLMNEAPKLSSFRPKHDLYHSFTWRDTPQGDDYWSDIHSQTEAMVSRSGRTALANRMATWPEPPVWRDANRSQNRAARAELVAMRSLVNDYIKAHLREPDRIDVLGDLYYVVLEYALNEPTSDLRGKMMTRLPVLSTFREYRLKLGYTESSHWRHVMWAQFHPWGGFTAATNRLDGALPWQPGYMVHVSVNDPIKVAYTKSVKDMLADRQMVTTPGRFIKKHYPHLTELQVKGYAEAHLAEHTPVQVRVARSASEIVHAVGDGPSSSCMANKFHSARSDDAPWFRGHVHPAAVYGHCDNDPTWDTDIEVLYFEKGGEVKARVICNAVTKACARIYGDEDKLLPAMVAMGYTQSICALIGARIRNLEDENHDSSHIIPYIDAGIGSGGGQLYYRAEGERHWMIGRKGNNSYNSYKGYENKGVSSSYDEDDCEDEDRSTCDSCGERQLTDNMTWTHDGDGDHVCEACVDEHYTYAIGRRGDPLLVDNENAVRCETDGEYYHDEYLSENDVYEATDGNYYKLDDLVQTSRGDSCYNDCTALDVDDADGNSWAEDEDVIETHDGRKVHTDESWEDHFTGKVYHQDDELEDDEGDEDVVLSLRTANGRIADFTASSMFASLDVFYVVGNTLTLRDQWHEGSGKGIERGAIPLTEYLLAFGFTMYLQTINGPYLSSAMLQVLNTICDKLTNPEEKVEDEYSLAA